MKKSLKMMKKRKQIVKKLLIAALLLAALYLIYIFAGYWDIALEAFRSGWEGA